MDIVHYLHLEIHAAFGSAGMHLNLQFSFSYGDFYGHVGAGWSSDCS